MRNPFSVAPDRIQGLVCHQFIYGTNLDQSLSRTRHVEGSPGSCLPHRQQFSHVLAVLYHVDPRCMFANATLELEVLISVAALVGLLLAGIVLLVALPLGLRLAGPTLRNPRRKCRGVA